MSITALPNNPYKLLGWFISGIVTKINEIIAAVNGLGGLPYYSYTAILSQTGAGAPTAVVLYNDVPNGLSAFNWTRNAAGNYTIDTTVLADKQFIIGFPQGVGYSGAPGTGLVLISNTAVDNSIQIKSYVDGSPSDDVITALPVEIRIYK